MDQNQKISKPVENKKFLMESRSDEIKIKDYFNILTRHKITILITVIICLVLSIIFSLVKPEEFEASVLLSIHRVNRQITSEFQYDNYYSIQAAEYVGNTVVGWLQTKAVITEIYKRAGLEKEFQETLLPLRKFRPKQISSHLVKVRITSNSPEKARKLSAALISVIQEKVKALELTPDNRNSFEIKADESIIDSKKYSPFLVAPISIIAGLFLGIGLAFLFEYLKK